MKFNNRINQNITCFHNEPLFESDSEEIDFGNFSNFDHVRNFYEFQIFISINSCFFDYTIHVKIRLLASFLNSQGKVTTRIHR